MEYRSMTMGSGHMLCGAPKKSDTDMDWKIQN